MRLTLSASLALACLSAAAPAFAAPKVWSQDWSVGERPTVRVRVDDAHVRVHRGPAGRVATRVEYELRSRGMVFGATSPAVVFERSGNVIRIQARDARGVGVVGMMDERFTVDVTVPREVELEVESTDGAIDCDSLVGRFQFQSTDGAVRAHGLRGAVTVATRDGRVILDDLDGSLHVRCGDGRLTAGGRFDALDVGSTDGRLDVEARRGSKVKEAWSLESRDGAVSLRIPVDLSALLDARTRDGALRVNLPIPAGGRERNAIVGHLNDGGPALRLRTQDGSITLGLSE
jgi:hypothetical protein